MGVPALFQLLSQKIEMLCGVDTYDINATMNDQSHKLITAEYITYVHYAVPRDWDLKDIDIKCGKIFHHIKYDELFYKGELQDAPSHEDANDVNYPNIIEDNNDDEVSQYFDCEEEEKPDIVFHCESCKKAIVRDSEDHDFSKCHEDHDEKWYCADCPCEEEEQEEEEEFEFFDENKKYICWKCNRNFTDECDDRTSFEKKKERMYMCGSCHSDGEEEPEVIVLTVKRKKKN